ncbi:FAD-dependent oxidoreductase [bacterium]|nr:FAD-dependent oxidoreductase [bacterium]
MDKLKYDVVIVGGGTSGVACAYTSSKLGLKILLLEKSDVLGGAITQGLVIPAMKTDDKNINNDFYYDLIKYSKEFNAQIKYSDENEGWFNPELLKIVFDKMLSDVNCDVLFSSEVISINPHPSPLPKERESVFSLNIMSRMLSLHIETKCLIDATANGKIFEILNLKFQKKLKNNFQTPSLRFMISNVDLKVFEKWIMELDNDREVTTSCKVNGQINLSTAYTWDKNKTWALRPVFEKAIENHDLEVEDSAYFQLFTVPSMPNTVAMNCPQVLINKDIETPFEYSECLKTGREKVLRLHNFCKKYLKGFENSFISHISDTLGIREDRRVEGKYIYTKDDISSSKTFDNIAFAGDYPIDIHSNDENVCESIRQNYYVPIECLMSKDYDNLFVIGRCLSADFTSQSALRIQRHCFSMGEAVAKYIAHNRK